MGLALWLIPSSSASRRVLEEEIRSLSNLGSVSTADTGAHVDATAPRLSSPPSAPFAAHATLLSGLQVEPGSGWDEEALWKEALRGVQEWREDGASESEARIQCSLREVTTRGTYFQCLLLSLTLPAPLSKLNQIMRRRFKKDADQPPYFPHISLLYANIPSEEARRLISHLEEERWFRCVEPERENAEAQVSVRDLGTAIEFDQVQLWDCNGPVADWRKLRSMTLDGKADTLPHK